MLVERNVEFHCHKFYEKFKGEIKLFPQGKDTGRSDIEAALSVASKKGTGKRSAPDFVGRFGNDDKTILVVECKADDADHKSKELMNSGVYIKNDDVKGNRVKQYACDGALHYGKILSPHCNIVALGVSGDKNGKISKVDYYYQMKGATNFVAIATKNGLLEPSDILREIKTQKRVVRYRSGELIKTAHSSYSVLLELGISPTDRAFLIGMLLIALNDKAFNSELDRETDFSALLLDMSNCVCDRFSGAHSAFVRQKTQLFRTEMEKSIGNNSRRKNSFVDLLRTIKRHKDGAGADTESDELGAFFTSFLTVSSNNRNEQQEMGIVLTPHHITEIFPMLAPIQSNDSVFADSCCGTGGFLIAALKALEEHNPKRKRSHYINKNIWGIEQDPKMYWLACLNMVLKGGDASNIILGDSFSPDILKEYSKQFSKVNIAFLNPPYSMKNQGKNINYERHELNFVRNACEVIASGGKVVAVMPAKAVAAKDSRVNEIKQKLMEKNTIEGVFKLSKVTFRGIVNVETIIMVCTAGIPHKKNHKVYFASWEDDGMKFVRNIGAVDHLGQHDDKVSSFVESFHRKKEVDGESIITTIAYNEEWLYQIQLMGKVCQKLEDELPNCRNVAHHILNYFASQVRIGNLSVLTDAMNSARRQRLNDPKDWRVFALDDVLELTKGKRFSKNQAKIKFKEYPAKGYIPYVSASDLEEKQGLNGYVHSSLTGGGTHEGNYMVMNYGGGQLNCFYREGIAYCTDNLNVAKIKDKTEMNVYIASYLKEMINQYKQCFSYNMSPSLVRMAPLKIWLPMKNNSTIDWKYLDRYAMNAFCEIFNRS